MRLSLIAAVADNGVIGQGNDIPWRLPRDWRRFKQITMGHHLLMGRKTYESIGRPLPGRTTVIITRGTPSAAEGVVIAGSLDEAVRFAQQSGDDEAFIAGGAEIYAQGLDLVERLYMTWVHTEPEGDTRFPNWERSDWVTLDVELHAPDGRHPWPHTFETLERAHR